MRPLFPVLSLLPLLILLLAAAPLRASDAPPIPEGIEPKRWEPPKEVRDILEEVRHVSSEAEMEDFLGKLEKTVEEHPDWLDLHRFYLLIAQRSQRMPQILARLHARAEADTANPDLHYLIGMTETGAEAERRYRRALALDPDHYQARCALAAALLTPNPGGREEAIGLLFGALRDRPDHPFAYQVLASAYGQTYKDYEKAVAACRMWAQVEPESAQPVQYEAGYLRKLGRGVEADQRLFSFAKEHPDNVAALRATAELHDGRNNLKDAALARIRIAEVLEDNPQEAYAAAVALAKAEEKERAFSMLGEAAERGFADVARFEEEKAFAPYRDDPAFPQAIETIRQAYEKSIPERRERILEGLIRQPAPAFSVATLDGGTVSLEELRGKVVVLDFWATWCGPCRMTLPLVQKLQKRMEGKPVEVVCMNVWERDAGREKVAHYWTEHGYPMRVGLGDNDIALRYGVSGIPTLYVIDQDGQLRYNHRGATSYMDEEVGWVVEALLAETK